MRLLGSVFCTIIIFCGAIAIYTILFPQFGGVSKSDISQGRSFAIGLAMFLSVVGAGVIAIFVALFNALKNS